MKAVILNCFDTYEERVDLVHDFFEDNGYDVKVIQSDFRHFKKIYRNDSKKNFTFIKTKSYSKNLSLKRLYSHYNFARKAFNSVKRIKPDVIYIFIPPNSLAYFASKYKIKNKNVKLILDLIDLWPETMPIGNDKIYSLLKVWRKLRDTSLKNADYIITECNLYRDVLSDKLKNIKTKTIYWAKKDIEVSCDPKIKDDEIHLAYLGSINNIIDIEKIIGIIDTIRKFKPVTLHIIGDGEKKHELITNAKKAGADIEDYGKIYNPQAKQDIFDRCHFGLNIMKDNVCVGLTMKSVDYFQHGLPIINNIPADTMEIVKKYNVGINVIDDFSSLVSIVSDDNIEVLNHIMRTNTQNVFERLFSVQSFKNNMNSYIRG